MQNNIIIDTIKAAGLTNTRIAETASSNAVVIEVYKVNQWVAITKPISKSIAEDIIKQASNKLLLG